MKKFVGIIVATVLAFSLVGCGPVDSAIQNIASSGSNTSSKSGVVTADDDGYVLHLQKPSVLFLRLFCSV